MNIWQKIKINISKIQIFQFLIVIILAIILAAVSNILTPLIILILVFGAGIFVFILEKPTWGILLFSLLLPLERIGSYDISGMTIRPSQIIFLVTMVAWIVNNLRHKKFPLVKNPLFWPIILFIGVNVAGLAYAPNLERSISTLIFTIFTMLIAILIPNLITNKIQAKRVITFLLLGYFLVTIFGIFQFMGDIAGLPTTITGLRDMYTKDVLGFPRVQSTSLEPLYFANYLLLPLGILLALFLSKKSNFKTIPTLGLLALGGINFILTVSRGGYIAGAIMLLVIALFLAKKVFKPKNILILLIVLLIIGSIAFRFFNLENSYEKFTEHTFAIFSGASYFERVYTFEQALSMWYQHPLIGWGTGSFGTYVSVHPYVVPGDGYAIVNNEPLELLAETGILGLSLIGIIALIIIIRSLKAIRLAKNDPYLKYVLIGSLAAFIGIVAQYQTFSILYITHIWFTIGFIIAIQNIIFSNHAKLSQ